MAKVILKSLVPDNSPIYNQPLMVGARLTKPLPMNSVKNTAGQKEQLPKEK